MKKLIFPIIFAICFTNYISAEEIITNNFQLIASKQNQEKKEISITQLLEYLLIQSSKLDLTDDQKKKLSNLPKKYIYNLTIKEGEYELSVLNVVEILTNPNFNVAELKSALRNSKAKAIEMSLISVDAIDEIRQIIGIENFKMILGPMAIKK